MPDPDFSFLSNEQNNDVLAGIGAGLQSYDPNNMFAGAGAAISANTASRVKREEPYRQFQASLKNKKIFQDMYAGKKANITDFGRLTENMKEMLKEMFGKARPVADVPPVDVVAENMKAFYDENVRNEPLMRQSMENDPEYLRRRSEDAPTPPVDNSTYRRPEPDDPNEVSGEDYQSNLVDQESRQTYPDGTGFDEQAQNIDDELKGNYGVSVRTKEEFDFISKTLAEHRVREKKKASAKKKEWALRTGKVGN